MSSPSIDVEDTLEERRDVAGCVRVVVTVEEAVGVLAVTDDET
jgi:hypothetical protein